MDDSSQFDLSMNVCSASNWLSSTWSSLAAIALKRNLSLIVMVGLMSAIFSEDLVHQNHFFSSVFQMLTFEHLIKCFYCPLNHQELFSLLIHPLIVAWNYILFLYYVTGLYDATVPLRLWKFHKLFSVRCHICFCPNLPSFNFRFVSGIW